MSNEHLTAVRMAALVGKALKEDGISQAEFCRKVGVSTRHLNQVIRGITTAAPAQLDYWAFALGRRWSIALVPASDTSDQQQT